MQLPLWAPPSTWRPPRVSELPSWDKVKRIGLDCETKDPTLKQLGPGAGRPGCHVAGFSLAIEDGEDYYVPLRHEGGDNVEDVEGALRYLREQAAQYEGIIVGANLGYELAFLGTEGVKFPKVKMFRDVLVADPLIDELQTSYSLENVGQRWNCGGKDEGLLQEAARAHKINPKSEMYKLPARYVGLYGGRDARLPLEILRKQERVIDEQDLWEVFDLESRVLPVLAKMRARGVRVHLGRLEEIERWSLQRESEALAEVHAGSGVRIKVGDVWRPEALALALEALGYKVPMTGGKKPKPSITKELLAQIDHPVARAIEQARKVNKLRTTFAQSVRSHLIGDRIHCSYNQVRSTKNEDEDGDDDDLKGAAYGRLSCEHPNLQQQPARDEFAKMWRSIYIPDDGQTWAALDYSQQEPRMVVHFAVKAAKQIGYHAAQKAREAAKKYQDDPTTDNHQMMADMAGIKRKPAKEIFLGLCYGMGGGKLCRKLGLPTMMAVYGMGKLWPADSPEGKELVAQGKRRFEAAGPEGQDLLNRFDAEVPFVRRLAKAAEEAAKKNGYVRTLSGRRCRFPLDEYGNYDWCHKALNRIIQGGSGDQTKRAMVDLDAAGHEIQMQVHDEIDGGVDDPRQATERAEIMMQAYRLVVPSKVDIELGASWGESMG